MLMMLVIMKMLQWRRIVMAESLLSELWVADLWLIRLLIYNRFWRHKSYVNLQQAKGENLRKNEPQDNNLL